MLGVAAAKRDEASAQHHGSALVTSHHPLDDDDESVAPPNGITSSVSPANSLMRSSRASSNPTPSSSEVDLDEQEYRTSSSVDSSELWSEPLGDDFVEETNKDGLGEDGLEEIRNLTRLASRTSQKVGVGLPGDASANGNGALFLPTQVDVSTSDPIHAQVVMQSDLHNHE
jgi:hypothetical protein